jgi:hypothetical protein
MFFQNFKESEVMPIESFMSHHTQIFEIFGFRPGFSSLTDEALAGLGAIFY